MDRAMCMGCRNLYNYLWQSVPITTNVASSNPANGEEYSIQHYVIKFVIDLKQVGGFLQVHTKQEKGQGYASRKIGIGVWSTDLTKYA